MSLLNLESDTARFIDLFCESLDDFRHLPWSELI